MNDWTIDYSDSLMPVIESNNPTQSIERWLTTIEWTIQFPLILINSLVSLHSTPLSVDPMTAMD